MRAHLELDAFLELVLACWPGALDVEQHSCTERFEEELVALLVDGLLRPVVACE